MTELIRRSVGPDITVRVDAEQAADAVLCDPNQLENALLNLAINGRDAMAVGGELLVAVRATRLRDADLRPEEDAPPGDYVELRVTDTGTGMDAQTAARAFEPFFTTKPQGSGSGLGLSQIYGFVRQSGGVVRLDSELGRGTTVRLLLPRHVPLPPPDPAAAPAPGRGEEAGHDRVVLLVEDEASVQGVVALHLRDGGWRVHCAPDGASAVRMIEAGLRPDALLTDVGLPHGMNGRQLADHVRTVLPDLPVLFVTGYAGRVLDEELSPGMQVIAKPFSFADLSERLRLMLRHG
jgi:CheY-like chemotaxis protein